MGTGNTGCFYGRLSIPVVSLTTQREQGGKGVRFNFPERPEGCARVEPDPVLPSGRSVVVVVDDDRSFVDALAIYLEDHGFSVIKAHTARDGIRICRHEKIDLAVVDVHLPDLEGTELAGVLRQWQPSTPVLLVSSDDSPGTVAKCLADNTHTFMAKPLTPTDLLNRIFQMCSPMVSGAATC